MTLSGPYLGGGGTIVSDCKFLGADYSFEER